MKKKVKLKIGPSVESNDQNLDEFLDNNDMQMDLTVQKMSID